ncbi:MAG: hypothetical protein ACRETG_09830 [Steroidobacteraceae bacterium]
MSIWLVVLIFALAAVVGLTMALAVFKGNFPPVPSAVIHGALAATGLVLVLILVIQGARGPTLGALVFFLLAALGGFTLAFAYHARKKKLPPSLVVGHAVLAVIGFLLLLTAALHLF